MKKNIYLYLLVFSLLVNVFQYVNSKGIIDKYEKDIKKFKAKIEILNKAKKLSQTPIVAIGGININNYKKLLLNNANLLAISSYVWNNKKFKPLETIDNLK